MEITKFLNIIYCNISNEILRRKIWITSGCGKLNENIFFFSLKMQYCKTLLNLIKSFFFFFKTCVN